MTNARFDQALFESAVTGTPHARFDQVAVESISTGAPKARFDQVAAEEITTGSPNARLDQLLVEYVVSVPASPVIPTVSFPQGLIGQGWSVHRRPTFSTRVAAAVSGREVLIPYYSMPLYEFELTYDVLRSGASQDQTPSYGLQSLEGFYLSLQGQYGTFLFTDPENCQVTGGVCGSGNGANQTYPLLRNVGSYSELIQCANMVTAVYLNGVPQVGSSWAVANNNTIQFTSVPPPGVTVSADFTYYFVCRFLDDVQDYEEFMYQLHMLKSCKFRTVRTS